ncbi:RDD family protein [Humisphaera borealis]|uniref:RDD family protein n=1 Tax=Humisphaera borealis TaxID=2807512 RepID=A0A7M2WS68_9BACT|nr:RDD family protein [Humisphaera borealis]QOV87440.1 RDD family protein [Humisphaera borealis]
MSLLARVATVSPFGPIFGKELRVTSRRKRTYLLRVGYLSLLLLALLLAYASSGRSYGGVAAQMQRQAALGTAFFVAFTIFSVGAMGLIGPVLTANAIGAEKLAKTLPVLLMTPITAWQVVSGKLFSRVLVALMLLGLSLPVLALCRLLGGVELRQMLAVLSIATSFVISCAAIGLFLSLFLNRAAIVILLAYGILGVLYILVPVVLVAIFDIGKGGPRGGLGGMQFLMALNPFGCAAMMCEPRIGNFLGDTWIACVIVQLAFAAGLVGLTSILLRRQFRNAGEKPIAMPAAAGPSFVPQPPSLLPSQLPPPLPAFGESSEPALPPVRVASGPPPIVTYVAPMTAIAALPTREVGDNPVLWRELRRPLLPKFWQRLVASLAVMAIMLLIYAVLAEGNDLDDVDVQGGFACVFFGVWWLLSAVLSATAISQEKETDTWTLLMAAPMSGSDIVWGKVVGLLRRMMWPTILMCVHFLLFVIGGVIPLWSILFVILMTVACNSIWLATGVWISLRIKKVTFAVIANLMLAIIAYGVVPLMVLIPAELLTRRGERLAQHTAWYIPYFYLAEGFEGIRRTDNNWKNSYYENGRYITESSSRAYHLPGSERVGSVGFVSIAAGCAAIHLLLAFLILRRTADNFDEIVGRAGKRRFVGVTDTDDALLPVGTSAPSEAAGRGGIVAASAATSAHPAALSDESPDLYASFGRRAVAATVDTAIVMFACSVVGLVWGVINVLTEAVDELDESVTHRVMLNHLGVAILVSFVVGVFYWAAFESSRRRATPGKLLMGIFVADLEGRRLSFGKALVRHVGKLVSALTAGAGFLEVLFNRRRQAMHDRMAGAVVLRK